MHLNYNIICSHLPHLYIGHWSPIYFYLFISSFFPSSGVVTWPPAGTSSSAGQPSSTDTCICRKQGRGEQIRIIVLKNETAFVNSNGKMRYAQKDMFDRENFLLSPIL